MATVWLQLWRVLGVDARLDGGEMSWMGHMTAGTSIEIRSLGKQWCCRGYATRTTAEYIFTIKTQQGKFKYIHADCLGLINYAAFPYLMHYIVITPSPVA